MNIYLISLIALASQAFGKDLECRRRDRCETLVDVSLPHLSTPATVLNKTHLISESIV
ncbi:hypothetical protein Ptr902_04145 [Pyrenophora tritici-repentis]|nr:hypothetical protein Ptr902_04145 [Pyrenophora tritici-repentis]